MSYPLPRNNTTVLYYSTTDNQATKMRKLGFSRAPCEAPPLTIAPHLLLLVLVLALGDRLTTVSSSFFFGD
jgi:hypothetical protein